MAETPSPSRSNGFRWPQTGLPTRLLLVGVLLAVVIVSGLIFVLYEETRGPGQILREFAREVDRGDCTASYELLDGTVQDSIDEERWCGRLPEVDQMIDATFTLEQAVLQQDTAIVTISESTEDTWKLRRFGERSWRVLGPPGGFGA
jgi:hypothetical protein